MLLGGWEDLGKSRIAIQVLGHVVMRVLWMGWGCGFGSVRGGQMELVWRRFADPC